MLRAEYVWWSCEKTAFSYFGYEPLWVPGERDVEGFVHDEVTRQGHDTAVHTDGGIRVQWMLEAWAFARATPALTIGAVERIGEMVEPWKNTSGFRTVVVKIGKHTPPDAVHVRPFIEAWVAQVKAVTPVTGSSGIRFTTGGFFDEVRLCETVDDMYLAYEWVHPFRDGNGRSGKILFNWLLGTLDDPVLVEDHFGMGNP